MDRAVAIEQAKLLKALINIGEVSTILDTFIPAFKKAVTKNDGCVYLHGNFNLGGTVSGRLSSSSPNMQNIPSTGTRYAKAIKKCFIAPPGWVMVGADFASLEDRISALTTKDPNKLKVYTDGYDGHCLRAHSYFGGQMPDIIDTVESINSIAVKYKHLRQDSKAPTFALTYQGTWHTLVKNLGMTKQEAKAIEHNYHELYSVSDEWVQNKMIEASKVGYTTVAFGLRLRTPILGQTLIGRANVPYEAASEGRTMGNAQGQSYGLLNNRAAIEFQERLLASDFKYDIKPIAHIHDAQYFIIREDIHVLKWFNDNLVECMEWQDLPEIQHPSVKLGGEVDIFHPTWADNTTIPNNASGDEIRELFE